MIKKIKILALMVIPVIIISSRLTEDTVSGNVSTSELRDSLRHLYERPVAEWPAPETDSGVAWKELAALPDNAEYKKWENNDTVKLGRLLFFDPRLSSSNQISCSSCHDPDLAWQDGRRVSLGNDHLQGSRNTPSLLNVFIQKELFWDGRAPSLDSQALQPLTTHHEMNMNLKKLPRKLHKIKGYKRMFKEVYQSRKISLTEITVAIAAFEKTIRSRKNRFDRFVKGNYKALSEQEIEGLHLFRTKARCMNCHYGTYFTDLQYHNIGLTYYGRKYEDMGRYNVTQKAEDVGKFKTPSLRDLLLTRPWMHNGLFDNLGGIINMYNSGMHQLDNKVDKVTDSLYPHTDPLLKPLNLSKEEKSSLVAFLKALSGVEYKMPRPQLPQ